MSKQRFFEMVGRYPRISHLWDIGEGEFKPDLFESELGVMSSGEVQIAKFFASVWFHDNSRYGFDLVDAVAVLDSNERGLIIAWIQDPFWP
ncbi:MAG: hypothetical protein HOP36_09445 [Methyloglobulus sp.]|nr:hypothetical protein [Methyloglobulus sp.]